MNYIFPLSIQLTLPENYENNEFTNKMKLLQYYRFKGVELNITEPEKTDPIKLKKYLSFFNLELTQFATGAAAKAGNFHLSSNDNQIRKKAIEKCNLYIEYASVFKAGIILGFMKGPKIEDKKQANELFIDSISKIENQAAKYKVNVLVEATNRYETSVANTLNEAVDIISHFVNPYLRILPDTFHMNIEETSLFGELVKYSTHYSSIHLSDNNRFFPGLGAINFEKLIRFLVKSNYNGGLAIEGNIKHDFESDLKLSMNFISSLLDIEMYK